LRRSRQLIIAEILTICKNGANKTRIVYQANLNFKTVDGYLSFIIKQGWVRKVAIKYQITPAGLLALDRLNEANKLLAGLILSVPDEK
jgi:predicted transcriptional regulator